MTFQFMATWRIGVCILRGATIATLVDAAPDARETFPQPKESI
ncbi:MAG: hypothetical protein ACK5O8_02555 [Pirellula sp.]|jgi:hypothetical protein